MNIYTTMVARRLRETARLPDEINYTWGQISGRALRKPGFVTRKGTGMSSYTILEWHFDKLVEAAGLSRGKCYGWDDIIERVRELNKYAPIKVGDIIATEHCANGLVIAVDEDVLWVKFTKHHSTVRRVDAKRV